MNPERVCENCFHQNSIRQVDEEVSWYFVVVVVFVLPSMHEYEGYPHRELRFD